MTIVPALLFTVLCAGAGPALAQGSEPSAVGPAAGRQQVRSGLIIAADIEGHLAIYDGKQQLVVGLDKPAGRQLQLALEPGVYEVRLTTGQGTRRAGILIAEGLQLPLGLSNFSGQVTNRPPATSELPVGYPPPLHHSYALDPRYRIELRFGGWGSGWYDYHDDWHYSGSAQGAFGFEYLGFIRNDLGVGIGISSLVSADGDWGRVVDVRAARVTTSIPVVVRWYPVRRVTRSRSVEPYVTAGIGPVFGWYEDDFGSTRVGTTFGGRLVGGVDFRLGPVFTLGVAGGWNWDAGFSDDFWREARPGGGEFTVVLGWNLGR
jgi:hypothetical protein